MQTSLEVIQTSPRKQNQLSKTSIPHSPFNDLHTVQTRKKNLVSTEDVTSCFAEHRFTS